MRWSIRGRSTWSDPAAYRIALRRAEEAVRLRGGQTTLGASAANNTLAFALYRLGRYSQAIEALKRATQIRPDFAGDLVAFALVRYRLGQRQQARADLTAAEKIIADAQARLQSPSVKPEERSALAQLISADMQAIVAEAKALLGK